MKNKASFTKMTWGEWRRLIDMRFLALATLVLGLAIWLNASL